MNGGNMTTYFIDYNIWLYRFILNSSDSNAIKKQQIATTITSQENLLISTQLMSKICDDRHT
jgi:predicted nucleic acid-binding protein